MHCCGKGYSFKKSGWIYLHIEGEPFERGFQHGYLLGHRLEAALAAIKHFIYITSGKDFQFFVAQADRIFKRSIKNSPECLEELRGISLGAQHAGVLVSVKELLAWNGFLELYDFWWPLQQKKTTAEKTYTNKCSAFIATGDATKDGSIIMAHNTWYDFIYAQNFNIIADIKPTKGHRILMQTMPGYLASMSDFFVTGGGLAGTETTFQISSYKEDGKPEFLRMREAMQYADTIKEWTEIMEKGNNGGLTNSWLIGDTNTGEIARFELGLKYTSLDITTNGMFTGYNAPEDPRIRNLEYEQTSDYFDTRSEIGSRRVRFQQITEEYYGKIDTAIAKKIIADHFDIYLNKENPSTRTICCHSEVDPCEFPSTPAPYSLHGTVDGKVLTSAAKNPLQFDAIWGRPCGTAFIAKDYLTEHPQWAWQQGYISDMPREKWTVFTPSMKDKE